MPERRRLLIRLAAAIAIAAGFWTIILWIGGGFDTVLFGIRVRSNDPAKPRLLAEVAFLAFAWLRGFARTKADLESLGNKLFGVWTALEPYIAWGLAIWVFVLGMWYLAPYAGGSDSYGYISQVHLWLRGHPFVDQPWTANVPWPRPDATATPLGYLAIPSRHVIVPTYSPGVPFIMTLIHVIAGYRAMFIVGPLSGATLVMATYGLGRRLGSSTMGVMAAWLIATSPVTLSYMVVTMSDIPSAAAWALAFYLLFGRTVRSAVGAGVAAGIATLIHPNHVPSACVMGAWLLFKWWRDIAERPRHLRRILGFVAGIAPCCAMVAGVYWWLYGSPLQSGYGPLGQYYEAPHILPNLRSYLTWLRDSQTPLAYLGLVALAFPSRRLWGPVPDRSMVVTLAALAATVWAQYMAFQLLESWIYLRYVAASWPAIMLGVSAFAMLAIRKWGKPALLVSTIALIAVGMSTFDFTVRSGGLAARQGEYKFPATGQLVRARTDEASIVFAGLYSGSLRYYGGRVTLRADGLDPEWLDRTVEWLAQRGIHTYALFEEEEVKPFVEAFAGQEHAMLAGRLAFVYQSASARAYFFDLSRSPDAPLTPEVIVETYKGPVFVLPAPEPTFALQ